MDDNALDVKYIEDVKVWQSWTRTNYIAVAGFWLVGSVPLLLYEKSLYAIPGVSVAGLAYYSGLKAVHVAPLRKGTNWTHRLVYSGLFVVSVVCYIALAIASSK